MTASVEMLAVVALSLRTSGSGLGVDRIDIVETFSKRADNNDCSPVNHQVKMVEI